MYTYMYMHVYVYAHAHIYITHIPKVPIHVLFYTIHSVSLYNRPTHSSQNFSFKYIKNIIQFNTI